MLRALRPERGGMKKRKPIIGIPAQYDEQQKRLFLSEPYERAIFLAGGVPIVLPLHAGRTELLQLLCTCEGILLPGGPDISPFYFEEETHPGCGKILPERDKTELLLVKELLQNPIHRGKPLLAICRGIQTLNIAMGGSIYQDIGEWRKKKRTKEIIEHWQASSAGIPTHTVLLEKRQLTRLMPDFPQDNWLEQILSVSHLRTNTFHHQIIRRLAEGFCVCGASKDGAIEAIHKESHPFCLGVQWHPEDLLDDRIQTRLFEQFIKMAGLPR